MPGIQVSSQAAGIDKNHVPNLYKINCKMNSSPSYKPHILVQLLEHSTKTFFLTYKRKPTLNRDAWHKKENTYINTDNRQLIYSLTCVGRSTSSDGNRIQLRHILFMISSRKITISLEPYCNLERETHIRTSYSNEKEEYRRDWPRV